MRLEWNDKEERALSEARPSPPHPFNPKAMALCTSDGWLGRFSSGGCLAQFWGSQWFLLCREASCSCHPRHAWPTTVLSEYQEISEQFLWVSATGRETLTLNSSPLPHGDQIAARIAKASLLSGVLSIREGFLLPTLVFGLDVC